METLRSVHPVVKIAKYTIADEVRQRAFLVMAAVCVVVVFLMRGCYQGNYVVNGQALDAATIVGTVSKVTFQAVAAGVMLIAALLAMRAFRRDRDHGMQSCILSKPISRRHYVAGKVLGLWALSMAFMFILHVIVFLTASVALGEARPEYLAASLACSVALLFVIVTVLLFSLLVPDVVAFLAALGIGVVDLVTEGIYALSRSQFASAMMAQTGARPRSAISLVDVLHYAWPKLSGAQHFASALIGSEGSRVPGPVYPLVNLLLYCVLLGSLLLWRFGKEEIV